MDPADADDIAAQTGEDVAGTVSLSDGTELPVTLSPDIIEAAEEAGVDPDRLRSAAVPADATIDIQAQTDRDSGATIPVQDDRRTDLANRLKRDRDFQFIQDEQIQKLQRNSINYTERVGRFLLAEDDLIPTIKERLKALITGEEGVEPKPADPDSDADQRLADHLSDVHQSDVRPGDVIDDILKENLMSARAVLRATDLDPLDLNSLDYLKDGITGEEIYVQDQTTVYTFDLDEDADGSASGNIPGMDLEQKTVDAQPLVIGDHVFDISLYDTPPLEAVADTAVNKMVLQRLKARKAEITSFGAVYASVEPPSYLPEDQYFDRVADDDWNGDGDTPPTKLERAMSQNIQNAFDTLKDFQSGTVMSVPDNWSLEQLDIPETDDPIDDQIRGYNRDISRRLLVPLDLIELQSGSELSRETMFATLMTTIAGWRREITRVFEQFAEAQAEIEDIDGEVEYRFPPLKDADTKNVIAALQHAGVAGLTQKEVRQMINVVQGVDLDPEPGDEDGQDGSPPAGGPDDPGERGEQMREMLEDQRRGPDGGPGGQQQGDGPPQGGGPPQGQGPPGAAAAASDAGGGSGNPNRAGGAGPKGRASSVRDWIRDIPGIDDPTNLSRDDIARIILAVERQKAEADWNPALHPRGPDGKFVERPWSLPSDALAVVNDDSFDSADLMEYLADTANDVDVDGILSDDGIRIDGIPDDIDDTDELKQAISDGRTGTGTPDTPDGDFLEDIPDLADGADGHGTVDPEVVDPEYSNAAISALYEKVQNGDIDIGDPPGEGALGLDRGMGAFVADAHESGVPTNYGNLASAGSIDSIQPHMVFDDLSEDQARAAVDAVNERLPDGYYAAHTEANDQETIRVRRAGQSFVSSEAAFRDAAGDGLSRQEKLDFAADQDLQERFGFPDNETRAGLDRAMMTGLRESLIDTPVDRSADDVTGGLSSRIETAADPDNFDDDDFRDTVVGQYADWMSGYDETVRDRWADGLTRAEQGRAEAGSTGANTFRLSAQNTSPDVQAHEASHGVAFAYGMSTGLRPDGRGTEEQARHPWDDPDAIVRQRSAFRKTVDDDGPFESNEVPGLDDWGDRLEAQTARVTEDDFDDLDDEQEAADFLRTSASEGDMIYADEPLPRDERFGDMDPPSKAYRVTNVEQTADGDDDRIPRVVTVEDYAGDEYRLRATQNSISPEDERGFVPDITGSRSGSPDAWGLDTADPDEHLGTKDLDGDDAAAEYFEALNEAWYRQALTMRDGDVKAAEQTSIGQGLYSVGNAGETQARLAEAMTGESNHSAAAARALVRHHPRLLEAFRQVRDPSPEMKSLLNDELDDAGADFRFEP